MTPRAGRIAHGAMMVFWAAQIVVVAVRMWPWDWRTYLVELSLAALLIGNWSGLSAERPSEVIES